MYPQKAFLYRYAREAGNIPDEYLTTLPLDDKINLSYFIKNTNLSKNPCLY